jgi:hypothetical protein
MTDLKTHVWYFEDIWYITITITDTHVQCDIRNIESSTSSSYKPMNFIFYCNISAIVFFYFEKTIKTI